MSKKYLGPLNNFKNMYIFLYSNRKSLFKEFKWVWTQMRFRPETLTCEIRERSTLANVGPPFLPRVSTFGPGCQQKRLGGGQEAAACVRVPGAGSASARCGPGSPRGVRLGVGPVATFPTFPRPIPLDFIASSPSRLSPRLDHSTCHQLVSPCLVSSGSNQKCVSLPFNSHSIVTESSLTSPLLH